MPITGRVNFDYSSNNHTCTIGHGDALFEVCWSGGGGDSIYIYNDPPSIDAVAIANGATEESQILDAARFDYSTRERKPKTGEIALLRNKNGFYAALKILAIKAVGYNSNVDEVSFRYAILEDGTKNFSGVRSLDIGPPSASQRVLLIGAGFSKNWGGMLAADVREFILRHPAVQRRPHARDLILAEPSFEGALEKVRTGLFEHEDEAAVEEAIQAAFETMDASYRNPEPPVLGATLNDFIARFCPGAVGVGTGYVFSLNQDLLLERIYGTQPDKQKLTLSGLTWHEPPPLFPAGSARIPLASPVDPTVGGAPRLAGNFNLIKLHGSVNWRSSSGSPSLVMGRRKALSISRSPLLAWYHRLFESVISVGNVHLMTIGYGWGDEHINEAIANAVTKNGLRVYDWNIAPADALLERVSRGSEIRTGLSGFITQPITEVMPPTPTNPGGPLYDSILRSFFS